MSKPIEEEQAEESPPVLGTWRRVYLFVAVFFIVEVAIFYVFTRYYS